MHPDREHETRQPTHPQPPRLDDPVVVAWQTVSHQVPAPADSLGWPTTWNDPAPWGDQPPDLPTSTDRTIR